MNRTPAHFYHRFTQKADRRWRLRELPDALDRMVRIALQNGQHLALIINDILDMDKLAAGKMEFAIALITISMI